MKFFPKDSSNKSPVLLLTIGNMKIPKNMLEENFPKEFRTI